MKILTEQEIMQLRNAYLTVIKTFPQSGRIAPDASRMPQVGVSYTMSTDKLGYPIIEFDSEVEIRGQQSKRYIINERDDVFFIAI